MAGVVFASPGVGYSPQPEDPQLMTQAKKLVDEGNGGELIQLAHRSYPSYVSAATWLDIAETPRQDKDFFGIQTPMLLSRKSHARCWPSTDPRTTSGAKRI